MNTIVLAHGLFGFGNLVPSILSFLPAVHYFNGVADHLARPDRVILEPQVNPIGSIPDRAQTLAEKILAKTSSSDRIHILAHSMGGLDSRCALAKNGDLAKRVATLVTIGTPHLGSPVADAIEAQAGPIFESIPLPLRLQMELEAKTGAIHELTTSFCADFDQKTPDRQGIRYINVAGDASRAGNELLLLQLSAAISNMTHDVNDGMVTRSSALRPNNEHLADWPVDHAGEIGWSQALLHPLQIRKALSEHLARYDAIMAIL
jgi:triacylglycerol lipase